MWSNPLRCAAIAVLMTVQSWTATAEPVRGDRSQVRTPAVRLNNSLPEKLVQRIDSAAKSRGQAGSVFLASAAEHEMARA